MTCGTLVSFLYNTPLDRLPEARQAGYVGLGPTPVTDRVRITGALMHRSNSCQLEMVRRGRTLPSGTHATRVIGQAPLDKMQAAYHEVAAGATPVCRRHEAGDRVTPDLFQVPGWTMGYAGLDRGSRFLTRQGLGSIISVLSSGDLTICSG